MKIGIKKIIGSFLLSIFLECLIVFLAYRITLNNIDAEQPVIRGDGKGYYDYLPAIFIYNDLNFDFRKKPIAGYLPEHYESLNINYEGKTVNKYFCGEAILLTPAFLIAHANCHIHDIDTNGYTSPYQNAVLITSMIMLVFGLYFSRKLLSTYSVPLYIIFPILIIFGFGTQLYFYTFLEPSYSHIYSFAAISALLLCVRNHSLNPTNRSLYFSAGLLGIIVLLRPVNLLILFFLPFLFEDGNHFKETVKNLITGRRKHLFISIFVFMSVVSIQMIIWFIQTGHFIIWSYQNESFIFSEPHMWDTLFSFKKGLFVYTPIFFITILLFLFSNFRNAFRLLIFFGWFLCVIYITSSWHMWWYGMSFGLRPMMDFTGVFILIFALSIIGLKKYFLFPIFIVSSFCVYLITVQSYQYRYFILHWDEMTYESYKKVFLQTEYRYRGLLWAKRENHDPSRYVKVDEEMVDLTIDLEKLRSSKVNYTVAMEHFPTIDVKCKYVGIQYRIENVSEDDLKILINVLDRNTNESKSYSEFYLFHHIDLSDPDKKLNYISPIPEMEADELKILFELNQVEKSKAGKLVIEKIVYYI